MNRIMTLGLFDSYSRCDMPLIKGPLVSSRLSIAQANVILLFLFVVPFIEPQLFKLPGMGFFDSLFAVAKLVSSVFIIVLYVRYKPSPIVLLMVACQAWILFSTIMNGGSLSRFAGPALTAVTMFMVGDMVLRLDAVFFCRIVRDYLSAFFIINAFTCALMSFGMDLPGAFLGMDNRWIYAFLPWVAITFIVDAATKGRAGIYAWLSFAGAFGALVLAWSVGAMLALALWAIAWLLFSERILGKAGLNMCTVLFVVFVVVQLLLVGGVLLPQLSTYISDYLHKDVTLSGRVYLWDAVLDVLDDNPLFGAGVQTSDNDAAYFYTYSGSISGTEVNHPHNYVLNVAYHGGFVAALIFVMIHYLICRRVDICSDRVMARCYLCFMTCYLFASSVDTLDYSLMYLLLALAASYPNELSSSVGLCKSKEKTERVV